MAFFCVAQGQVMITWSGFEENDVILIIWVLVFHPRPECLQMVNPLAGPKGRQSLEGTPV